LYRYTEARALRKWETQRAAVIEAIAHRAAYGGGGSGGGGGGGRLQAKLDELERAGDDAGALLASMSSHEQDEIQAAQEANQARRHAANEDTVRSELVDKGVLERRVRRTVKLRVSGLRRRFNGGGGGGGGGAVGPTGAALLTAYDLNDEVLNQLEEGSIYELTDLLCRRGGGGGGEVGCTS
jgi:hypothetical protein